MAATARKWLRSSLRTAFFCVDVVSYVGGFMFAWLLVRGQIVSKLFDC